MRSSGEPVPCFVDNTQFSRIASNLHVAREDKLISYLTLGIFCLNFVSQGTTRSARGVWRPNTSPH